MDEIEAALRQAVRNEVRSQAMWDQAGASVRDLAGDLRASGFGKRYQRGLRPVCYADGFDHDAEMRRMEP